MDYKEAGVDIDKGNAAKKAIKDVLKSTYDKGVLSELGVFGSMFELKGYKNPVLVSSVDSVGTKLKLAFMLNKHDTVGVDMVGHSVNDILVQGAKPLFFLDYLGMNKVEPELVKEIVTGIATACKENGMALIGGETAELRDLYAEGEYDLVGCIFGAVEKDEAITGEKITPGNAVIGLPSNGLHTNGYTLARKVLDLNDKKVVDALMQPHKSYLKEVMSVKKYINGMAHITGGGIVENVPRVLPDNCRVELHFGWEIPWIFKEIQEKGNIEDDEMYRTFNMGIGFVIIVDKKDKDKVLKKIPGSVVVGEVV
ncbi:phosphoribosylformylglycinamidine cyclo-ligase [Nanoarchaeota archaeon]